MIRILTLGAIDVRRGDGRQSRELLAQPKRLALLVYLALARPSGFHRRDTLLALFWPEQDTEHARNALNQAIFFLRRALGEGTIVNGGSEGIGVAWNEVSCDARDFDRLLDAGEVASAAALYRGELMAGFHVADASPELSHWLDAERSRLAQRWIAALERLATERESVGDAAGAVAWWRQAAAADPLSSRIALRLMCALVHEGDAPAALRHAKEHADTLHHELEAPLDGAIVDFVTRLRTEPRAATALGARPPAAPAPLPLRTSLPPTKARPVAGPLAAFLVLIILAGGATIAWTRWSREPAAIRSIAVLPLENLSGDPAEDYLAGGITEALTTELARRAGLKVISRTSANRYRGSRLSLPQIARQLGVDAIVEGSVVRDHDRVRVDAQVIDARSDRHLWANRYERDFGDLVALEEEIATSITGQIRHVIEPPGAKSLSRAQARDPAAEELYLRGRYAWRARNPAALQQSILFFREAIARDSSFALAHAGLADSYRFYGGLNFGPILPYMDSARASVARALAIDSSLSAAHASLAALLTDAAQWKLAELEFRRAIDLEPSNAVAHHWYAMMLATLDRRAEAVREIRRARELDPLSGPLSRAAIEIDAFAHPHRDAHPTEHRPIVDPTYKADHYDRALGFAEDGRCDAARDEMAQANRLSPTDPMVMAADVRVQVRCGNVATARAILERIERRPDARLNTTYIAMSHTALGETDSAFVWLGREQYWGLLKRYELRTSVYLAPLRTDRRFAWLLKRVGVTEVNASPAQCCYDSAADIRPYDAVFLHETLGDPKGSGTRPAGGLAREDEVGFGGRAVHEHVAHRPHRARRNGSVGVRHLDPARTEGAYGEARRPRRNAQRKDRARDRALAIRRSGEVASGPDVLTADARPVMAKPRRGRNRARRFVARCPTARRPCGS